MSDQGGGGLDELRFFKAHGVDEALPKPVDAEQFDAIVRSYASGSYTSFRQAYRGAGETAGQFPALPAKGLKIICVDESVSFRYVASCASICFNYSL